MAALLCLVALRLYLVPPILFFEGDDAALCTGIARLSTELDIGPYYYHPPRIPVADSATVAASALVRRHPTRVPFYRYDTMPGMYFLGYVTRPFASPAVRMAWICFIAGTLSPLLLALFLVCFLRPTAPFALLLCYAAIATSPEQWVSGSVYINDKIVTACCLAGALWLITISSKKGPLRVPTMLGAGALMGLGALMRLDTALLVPSALLIIWIETGSFRKAVFIGTCFILPAVAVYIAVCAYMRAPLPFGAVQVVEELSLSNTKSMSSIALSAFGPLRVVLFFGGAGMSIASAAYLKWRHPGDERLRRLGILHNQLAALVLLVVPEMLLLAALPFKSQKYVLVGSCVVSGLAVLVPLILCETLYGAGKGSRHAAWAVVLLAMGLLGLDGYAKMAVADGGADGLRFVGGHFRLRFHENSDVTALLGFLDRKQDNFRGEIAIIDPTWVFEQSLAYYAASRSWRNTIEPSSLVVEGAYPEYLTLNRYVEPATGAISLLAPCDCDASRFSTEVGELARISEASGRPAYLLMPGQPLKRLEPGS